MFDLDQLPERMRYAAEVLSEATVRSGPLAGADSIAHAVWAPSQLCVMADRWQAEDAAALARASLVEQLAQEMDAAFNPESAPDPYRHGNFRVAAAQLIAAGWSKTVEQ